MGAIHGRGYYDRIGLSEACFSGARGRCRGSDGSAQAASACAGSGVLQSTAALSGWPGGVRDGEVRLMPAQYVKAYVKRNKHDAADAEAICEAVQRPTMRFVPVKTAEQQATQLLHRGREQLVRQRTMLVNALRAHLAEFGIVAAQGLRNVGELIAIVRDDGDTRLPDMARQVVEVPAKQIEESETAGGGLWAAVVCLDKENPVSQGAAR